MCRPSSTSTAAAATTTAARGAPDTMDRVAIALSGLCLVHCLVIPVAVVVTPALAALVLGSETTVHWIFLAMAVPTSWWALWRGFRKQRNARALTMGLLGLSIMFLGVSHLLDPALEVPLTVVGVSLVVVAHVLNLRRMRSAGFAALPAESSPARHR